MKSNKIHELILSAAAQRGNKIAFRHIYAGKVRELAYRDLARLTYLYAQALTARGLNSGDRLILCADNSPEWVLCCLAAFRLGVTVVPVDARVRQADFETIAAKAQSKLFVLGRLQHRLLSACVDEGRTDVLEELLAVIAADPGARSAVRFLPVPKEQPALIVFTSGTSGAAKGVVLTHANIAANVAAIAKPFDVTVEDKLLSVLPLSHMFEFTCGLLAPLVSGATIVYARIIGPDHLRELLKIEKISVLIGVPAVFKSLMKGIEAAISSLPEVSRFQLDIARRLAAVRKGSAMHRLNGVLLAALHKELGGRIKFWAAGGAPLPAELVRQFEALGIPLLAGYGLSEASPVVAANTRRDNRPGSAGRPLAGLEVAIAPLPEYVSGPHVGAEVGEIVVRGASVMPGYFHDDDATQSVLRDGWLHTGDLGKLDAEGYLWITGRAKSTIVTGGGYNIQPEELESALEQSPAIEEACVFGMSCDGGESAFAILVPSGDYADRSDDSQFFQSEINRCLADLAEYKRLAGWQVSRGDLPRTRTGKILRAQAAEIFGQLQARLSAAQPTAVDWDEDGQAICRILCQLVEAAQPSGGGQRSIWPHSNLSGDLGIDSFARMELALHLEEYFGWGIIDEAINDVNTVAELISLVKAQRRQPDRLGSAPELSADEYDHLMAVYETFDAPGSGMRKRLATATHAWPFGQRPVILHSEQEPALLANCRRSLMTAAKLMLAACTDFQVYGADRLSIDPPFIVVANHTSHMDTLAIVASFPNRLIRLVHPVAAADTFFSDRFQAVVSAHLLNAIPFDRFGDFEQSLQECQQILHKGEVLVVFPEGTRSSTGQLGAFRAGAARLAVAAGCPIVPAYIDGAFGILPKGALLPRPGRLRVAFGLPIYPPAGNASLTDLRDLTNRIRAAVVALRQPDAALPERQCD